MISVHELVHRHGDTVAVDGVSLTIDDGEFVVLAGPNGSGKTTLVRHLNGLLDPDNGEVRVDGTRVQDDLVAARTTVAMVFQHPRDQFVAATVGEDVAFGPRNLGLPNDTIQDRVADALEAVGLAGRHDDRIDSLSGGEQQRLAIAGALAMDPQHLVLDEPFTGLDNPARETVHERLAELKDAGTSIILVTHDLRDLAALADRVVVMQDGSIATDGPLTEVRDRLEELGVRPPTRESSTNVDP